MIDGIKLLKMWLSNINIRPLNLYITEREKNLMAGNWKLRPDAETATRSKLLHKIRVL